MSSLRQAFLQAELNRIEQEAESKSYSIMNKADQLALAHHLCQLINQPEKDIVFTPSIVYHTEIGGGCDILIYTRRNGGIFLEGLTKQGLKWERQRLAYDGNRTITIEKFTGVDVIVQENFLAAAQLEAAA